MNDKPNSYQVDSVPITIEAFRNRPCSNSNESGDYVPPSPAEIRSLRSIMGWSQNDVARLVGVTYNPKKGSTAVRKWETEKGKTEHREISYSAWRLMLLYAGVVSLKLSD